MAQAKASDPRTALREDMALTVKSKPVQKALSPLAVHDAVLATACATPSDQWVATSNHDKPDLLASSWSRSARHETYGIYRFHCRTCKASACTSTDNQHQLQDIETEAAALHTPLVVSPLDLGSNRSGCWPPSESVERMLRSQDRRANWQPHAGSMCWISCAAASDPLQFCDCTRAVPWRSSVRLGV